jgi:hypothetical protein
LVFVGVTDGEMSVGLGDHDPDAEPEAECVALTEFDAEPWSVKLRDIVTIMLPEPSDVVEARAVALRDDAPLAVGPRLPLNVAAALSEPRMGADPETTAEDDACQEAEKNEEAVEIKDADTPGVGLSSVAKGDRDTTTDDDPLVVDCAD